MSRSRRPASRPAVAPVDSRTPTGLRRTASSGILVGLILAVSGLAGAAAADTELVSRDLFISLDSQPTNFTFDASGPVGSRSGNDAFASDLGVSLGGRWSFTVPGSSLGVIAGFDLDATDYLYRDSAKNFSYGARAVVGLGWQVTDTWQVLVEPTLEYGLATFTFPTSTAAPSYEATGTYLGYGVRVAGVYAITRAFSCLASVGWKRIDNRLSGDGVDLTVTQSGLAFSLGLLYRFSAAPARIE